MKTKKLGPFSFKIDRPSGFVKKWPQPDGSTKSFTYPCDYGYWPKIKGEDGEGLDAFVGDDEKGHLESFQKLNPDGSLDETKFLLGVSDAEREKIYKLYGTEVHARRVYETFDDVQKALDTFKTKMHGAKAFGAKLAELHSVKSSLFEAWCEKHASNVFNALNWIPEPYQDRVQTPYQMLTSARNTPALSATQPNLRMLQISRENAQY